MTFKNGQLLVATKIVQLKHGGRCTFQLKNSLSCESLLPESGGERESLFSNLEAVMAREEPGLSRSLTFEPATLSIFSGSRCLHEVTKVDGERDRFVAVFCFSTKAGVKNSAKVQEMFWGRVVD